MFQRIRRDSQGGRGREQAWWRLCCWVSGAGLLALVGALVEGGCGPGRNCTNDNDCPGLQICLGGRCQSTIPPQEKKSDGGSGWPDYWEIAWDESLVPDQRPRPDGFPDEPLWPEKPAELRREVGREVRGEAPADKSAASLSWQPSQLSLQGWEGGGETSATVKVVTQVGERWSLSSNKGWLQVAPSQGRGPQTVRVKAQSGGLSAGSHQGTIEAQLDHSPGRKASLQVTLQLKTWSLQWKSGPSLPDRTLQHSLMPGFTVEKFLYALRYNSTEMFRLEFGEKGPKGKWQKVGGGYKTKWGHPVLSVGNWVYSIGDWGRVRAAPFDPSSRTLGAWIEPAMVSEKGIGNGRHGILWGAAAHLAVGKVHYLYSIGGFEYAGGAGVNPRPMHECWVTTQRSNGRINNWKQTASLPYAPMNAAAVVVQSGGSRYLVVLGGGNNTTDPIGDATDKVVLSKINTDGTLGSFQQVGRLPYKAMALRAFVHRDYVYILGGGHHAQATSHVYRARITSGGLSSWKKQPSLPGPVGGTPFGLIPVKGGHLFVVLGLGTGSSSPLYWTFLPQ